MSHPLAIVFAFKMIVTILLWCLPLLCAPPALLSRAGLPAGTPVLFLRLLGMAYLALLAGYWFGLQEALAGRNSEVARITVCVGLVSNLGAFLLLLYFGWRKAWSAWGRLVRAGLWLSLIATGLVSTGLLLFGFR